MKTVITLVVIIILSSTIPVVASGEAKPIQLSLFDPIQIFPATTDIVGVRLSLLYGRNASVAGLDWGLVNHTTTGTSKGYQTGLVGISDDRFVGWQNNFVNISKKDFEGFQLGFVNIANNANGFQLGFVNYAVKMKGLQIGLVNIIKQGGQFPVFPIVNWSF